jgi:uncharacterized protein
MPPISVLIKPASSKCNLNCAYCFYHDVANNRTVADLGFMSLETVELIIKKVLQFASGYATFSFQGGEPTLCGIDFFKSVIKLQNRLNVHHVKISNCIQTNGALIDTAWADFLHDNGFLVGLSLDGPQDVHDRYRVDAKGIGTHERVMQTSELFDRYKVEYNILFVVTEETASHADALYDFYQKKDFNYLQFMPCIDPAGSKRGVQGYSLHSQQYAFFLKHFFDRWYADFMGGKEISIRYFDNLVRMVMGAPPETCSMRGACGCQFVFEADGSVYPCDFYVTDAWKLGNIFKNELIEMYEGDTCIRFIKNSLSTDPACRNCKWKSLCRGGCRRDRENMLTGELERNYYCASFCKFLEYAYPRLLDIANYVKKISSQPKQNQAGSQP